MPQGAPWGAPAPLWRATVVVCACVQCQLRAGAQGPAPPRNSLPRGVLGPHSSCALQKLSAAGLRPGQRASSVLGFVEMCDLGEQALLSARGQRVRHSKQAKRKGGAWHFVEFQRGIGGE